MGREKHIRNMLKSMPEIDRKDCSKSPRGLWDNIRSKQERGGKMRKPGSKGAPTYKAIRDSQT